MKWSAMWALAALAALAAISTGVHASVVTVTPSNPGDWSWMANTAAALDQRVYFTRSGPAPAEGNPIPTGNGAFYAWLDWDGGDYASTPCSAWLGVDRHGGQSLVGIKLSQIKKLEYTVYNGGVYNQNVSTSQNKRRYPGQPFMLNFTVMDGAGNYRQLWYRPWGHSPLGWEYWNNRRAWLTLDAVNMTSTPDFSHEMPPPKWYNWWFDNGVSTAVYDTWAQMLAYSTNPGVNPPLGDCTLVPTSTTWDPANGQYKSAGWDSTTVPPGDGRKSTGTGKCLNLWVGARKASLKELGAWVKESMNFSGYVDTFTLGVDFNNDGDATDPGEEITYDFATDPTDPGPTVVAVCNTGLSRWGDNPPSGYPYAIYRRSMDNRFPPYRQTNQHQFIYRWFGQVQDLTAVGGGPARDDLDTREFYFTIWDGTYANVSTNIDPSGKAKAMVEVRWPYQDSETIDNYNWDTWPVHIGDWVSVEGFLYDRFYRAGDPAPPPAEITASSVRIHYTEYGQ